METLMCYVITNSRARQCCTVFIKENLWQTFVAKVLLFVVDFKTHVIVLGDRKFSIPLCVQHNYGLVVV